MQRTLLNFILGLFLLIFSISLSVNVHGDILSSHFELSPTVPSTADEITVTVTIVLPVPCYNVTFSAVTAADHAFHASAEVMPPKPGTVCIEVLGRFSHTYTLGRLLDPTSYRFELSACERDPIEGSCVIAPLSAFEFTVITANDQIPSGLDHYAVESSQFSFVDEFTLPAGFFDEGSRAFQNTVRFTTPLVRVAANQSLAHPITAVASIQRKESVGFDPANKSTKSTPIELVSLSLRSTAPITVLVKGRPQLWDVYVELSPQRASNGQMTLTKRNQFGGTFSFELTVFPLFCFIRQSDGLKRVLDSAALQLSPNSLKKLTLKVSRVPWLHHCLALGQDFNTRFCPGVTLKAAQRLRAQSSLFKLALIFVPNGPFAHTVSKLHAPRDSIGPNRITYARVEIFRLTGEKIFSGVATELSMKNLWGKFSNGVYLARITQYSFDKRISSELKQFIVLK